MTVPKHLGHGLPQFERHDVCLLCHRRLILPPRQRVTIEQLAILWTPDAATVLMDQVGVRGLSHMRWGCPTHGAAPPFLAAA